MPCFNESKALVRTASTVAEKIRHMQSLGQVGEGSCMLFSDDGSGDDTWSVIERLHAESPTMVKGVKLAANRGKEYALYAGLMEAKEHADIVICMDSDLQHDINAVDDFLEKYQKGYDLIYGIKKNRGKESFLKKGAASLFYTVMQKLGSPILKDHTDYSLMTKQVLTALSEYGETNFIFRGILRSMGFKQCICYFNVLDRQEGESKFSFRKLLHLSMDAITSFSVAPLHFIGMIGVGTVLVSLIMLTWTVYDFFCNETPSGWATVVCSIWFIGGVLMLCLAVVGEYIGKMYMEAKKRPRYFVEKKLG